MRYHPRDEDNGDIAKWLDFVRKVVRSFGPNERVTGLQITNEVNISFLEQHLGRLLPDAVSALVRGVIAAKRESRRRGYEHQEIGFNYAFRFGDANDAGFWDAVGRQGGAGLRRATDWVGLDIYPGTFVPGRAEIVNLGDALLEGIAQTRECYMRKAGFTRSTPLRIEEIGYPTGPGRSEPEQERAFAGSWGPPWPTAAPTASPTFAGSASGTTTRAARTSSPSSDCCATTTRPSRHSAPTAD